MHRFTFKLMTAVAGLGLMTVNALAQERERDERREGERRERTERDSDRERPRGERSRSGERSERSNRGERSRRPQAGGSGVRGGFPGRPAGRPGGAGGFGGPPGGTGGFMRMFPIMAALDADGNGEISTEEIKAAPAALKKLDKNNDGKLTDAELLPSFPGVGGNRGGSVRGGRSGFGGRGGAPQGRPSFEGDNRPQSPRGGADRRERGERGQRGGERSEREGERRRRPSRPRE